MARLCPDRLRGAPARRLAFSVRERDVEEAVMCIRPVVGVTRVVLVCVLFLVLAWSSVPAAQDRRLLDANGYVRDDAYARPLVPAADQKYLKIDGLKMKDTLKEVVNATFGVGLIADMDPNASGDMGVVAKDVPSIEDLGLLRII